MLDNLSHLWVGWDSPSTPIRQERGSQGGPGQSQVKPWSIVHFVLALPTSWSATCPASSHLACHITSAWYSSHVTGKGRVLGNRGATSPEERVISSHNPLLHLLALPLSAAPPLLHPWEDHCLPFSHAMQFWARCFVLPSPGQSPVPSSTVQTNPACVS